MKICLLILRLCNKVYLFFFVIKESIRKNTTFYKTTCT
ncbi:hypothetical protein A0H76_3044 [Hepatospora eriocheir]|uniref:Uncharacterized protein n=1 Tax=Hepatospora eriocheir TaxID=1081669 RepID=A0A1X0QFX7_9MICR|nr:hypothetical protein A0H76_3044 [Hepatospora eriocheir]